MNKRHSFGFTIIELMLAMSFVSVLLVSVAMLTIQISRQYTAGVTMKEVNQAGTEISNDIRRTLAESVVPGVTFATKSNGAKILCTGQYSYIANSPESIDNKSGIKLGTNQTFAHFVKIRDVNGVYCGAGDITAPLPVASSTELLGGDRSLVVRNFSISPTAAPVDGTSLREDYDAGRMLYTVSLSISTGTSSEIIDTPGDSQCKPPSDIQSGAEYCAIDTFVIVARVGNTVN